MFGDLYFTGENRSRTSKRKISCNQPEPSSKQVEALGLFRAATALAYRPAAKRRRLETRREPRTQVLPDETLLDVFYCEDRDTLECLQLTCGRFGRIVCTKMNGLCLRLIHSACLWHEPERSIAPGIHAKVVPLLRGYRPTKRGSPGPELVYNANSIELATEWIFAGLRCAWVGTFDLHNVALSKHFLMQLKEAAPTFNVSGNLYLGDVGFPDDVTPAALISAFPGINYVRTKNMQSKHIDDALLRCYAEKGFWEIFPKATKGVEYERVSEKGILDFCFGYSERARGSPRVLKLRKPAVTQEFVSNLVKAHQSCEHNDPIRLEIADISHQNPSGFDYSKQPTDADGSFTAILPGDNPLKVSYYATCNTWFIQRGFE